MSENKCPTCEQEIVERPFCAYCNTYLLERESTDVVVPGNWKAHSMGGYHTVKLWTVGMPSRRMAISLYLGISLTLFALMTMTYSQSGKVEYPLLIFGVPLFYAGLLSLFNKTKLHITESFIDIKRGPIYVPFAATEKILRAEMKSITLQKVTHKGSSSYYINLVMQDGEIKQVLDLDSEGEAIREFNFMMHYLKLPNF